MALWGTLRTVQQQLACTPRFEIALAYLAEAFDPNSAVHARILAVPEGETQRAVLGGGIFVLVQGDLSKRRGGGRFGGF